MKVQEKELARALRRKGYSLQQIIEKTNFSKASVSVWVRDIELTKKQQEGLSARGRSRLSIEKRRRSRLHNEQIKRDHILNEAKKDYTKITTRELKLIGIALYLGEGAKTKKGTVGVASSDPSIIMVMMRFFREICHVPEEKFRGQIHTFAHAPIEKTEKYWSHVTGIPRKQFYKTYSKPSSASLQKRKTLLYGTLDISINNTKLLLTILGWIEKIKELSIASRTN